MSLGLFAHSRIRRVVVGFVLCVALLAPSLALHRSAPAYADQTATPCDIDYKYWCFYVSFRDLGNYVAVDSANMKGATGNGGATSWQRFITSLWRQDPSTGTWFNLINPAPDPNVAPPCCLGQPAVWYTDTSFASNHWVSVYNGYYVSDDATAQMRGRYQSNAPTGAVAWCSNGYDFNLTWNFYQIWGVGTPC